MLHSYLDLGWMTAGVGGELPNVDQAQQHHVLLKVYFEGPENKVKFHDLYKHSLLA